MVAAVVLLSGTSAMGSLALYATWNAGPDVGGYSTGAYPAYSWEAGVDFTAAAGGPVQAVSAWPFSSSPPIYPNSDGVGMWGGSLYDEVGDGSCYVTIENGGTPTFNDFEGTAEFWFKPDWDPQTDTVEHSLFYANRNGPEEDGLWIRYDGAGVMTTRMKSRVIMDGSDPPVQIGGGVDYGHTWTANPLVQDWNHVAVSWDANGVYSYANGVKTGETLYAGPDKMDFYNDWMGLFLGNHAANTSYQSDGMWDSMAVWSDVQYTGPDYTVPTEEIPEPATLVLLGLGAVAAVRRRRR